MMEAIADMLTGAFIAFIAFFSGYCIGRREK